MLWVVAALYPQVFVTQASAEHSALLTATTLVPSHCNTYWLIMILLNFTL